MAFVVCKLDGEQQRELLLDEFTFISDIKERLQISEGVPICSQRLVFAGNVLENNLSLGSCGIGVGSVLTLLVEVGPPAGDYRLVDGAGNSRFEKELGLSCTFHVSTDRNVLLKAQRDFQVWDGEAKCDEWSTCVCRGRVLLDGAIVLDAPEISQSSENYHDEWELEVHWREPEVVVVTMRQPLETELLLANS
eukprot:TRINITY_DN57180_c0_g1_i1.p1 TRINITY_DN57180_c0_g1~~TRINITY_DN57180_c0_g1_i1.p1  ORF type:complete len:206 (-),score=30.52 TRINITY_DN57180_c0_g1_i1:233-811(-)